MRTKASGKSKVKDLLSLSGLGILALLFVAFTCVEAYAAEGASETQACGGNSTVDALGAKSAAGYRSFLAELQAASAAGDKEKIAAMVNFPLLVLRDGARTRIRSKQTFLAQYDEIFTLPVRNAIAQQPAACLFGNDLGAMVGNGEVWFVEQYAGVTKIITVNDSASRR